MSNHLMLDFETLDTTATSVVLSLGIVLFNKEKILTSSYYEFDIKSQMEQGRTMSADTIMWWLNQTSGRKFTPPSEHYVQTLYKIKLWFDSLVVAGGFDEVWANDPNFDCAILEDLFKPHGGVPYKFWQTRSMRTFIKYVGKGEKVKRTEGQKHNALVDALDQAEYVRARLV